MEEKYNLILEQYSEKLKGYCYKLAGVPWDGDDLFQETLMKAYKSIDQLYQINNLKAYLFKIATNTWIDTCRKRKMVVDSFEDDLTFDSNPTDFQLIEALEEIIYKLPIRQASVVLLIDAFSFSIKETAQMLETTEGAVKATIHRARSTLKSTYQSDNNYQKEKIDQTHLVKRFLEAFKQGKPREIVSIYHELVSKGVAVIRTSAVNGFYFEFKDPDGNVLSVFQKISIK